MKTLAKALPRHLKLLGILITGTIAVWQFQYHETGRVYWHDRPLKEWGDPKFSPPSQSPHWNAEGYLSYPSTKNSRSLSNHYWLADGAKFVKVRLKHRSPGGLRDPGPGKGPPVLVQVVGYTKENRPLLKSGIMVAASDPGKNWQTLELVGRIPEEACTLGLIVLSRSWGGEYQIAAIDAVEVARPHWVIPLFMAIVGGWLFWIYSALHRRQGEHSRSGFSTMFATLWIFGWGVLLVFPRPLDHARPVFKTFFTSEINPALQIQEWIADEPSKKDAGQIDHPKKSQSPPPENGRLLIVIQQWFKSLEGGRFLLHFGVMGTFAGVLFLLMSFHQAWPAIASIALGAEIVPGILIGVVDRKDLWDLSSYLLAIGAAHFVASRLQHLIDSRHSPPAG